MRYVALTAAVFGGAIFLASGSPASSHDAQSSQIINPSTSITQIIAASQPISTKLKTKPAAKLASAPQPAPAAAPAPVIVTVASGDSLTSIAQANNTTTQRLYDANPDVSDPNLVFPGQQLRVPTADEALADRPMPVPAPAPAPAPVAAPAAAAAPAVSSSPVSSPAAASAAAVAGGSVWDSLAQCESSGNWSINTGNGFYGGLQFTLATWQGLGGTGLPSQASREEQIARAEVLQSRSGWGQWPACTAKLGLR